MIWLALAVAVLLWWLMTGLALMSVHQPRALRQPIFLLATIFATVSIWGVEANAASHTMLATVAGFAMGLIIWAWLELSYLMGYITGPVKRPATASMTLPPSFRISSPASTASGWGAETIARIVSSYGIVK